MCKLKLSLKMFSFRDTTDWLTLLVGSVGPLFLIFYWCSHFSESTFSPKFNEKDGHVERKSQNGLYEIENGRPR